MDEYEARVGKLGDVRSTTLLSMSMITADPATKAHFWKGGCTGDLDRMKREVSGTCISLRAARYPMDSVPLVGSQRPGLLNVRIQSVHTLKKTETHETPNRKVRKLSANASMPSAKADAKAKTRDGSQAKAKGRARVRTVSG